MGTIEVEAGALLARMSLLSYGTVQRLGGRRGEPVLLGPPGEAHPMHEEWALLFEAVGGEEARQALLDEARAEYNAYVRRPLVSQTMESLEELCARIVEDGWGLAADECARAMRCTPTLVRRARLAGLRHPQTGYLLPGCEGDRLTWARALDHAGLSLREIEGLTGIPKSTVDRLVRRALTR